MFYAGLDLGQRRDPTALAIVERQDAIRAFHSAQFHRLLLRHAERMPLGTPYPCVVERVREVLRGREIGGRCALAVDATGVGAPVVELLRAGHPGCEIAAVTITGGERESCSAGSSGNNWSVPKRDLIAGLQVLIERGELKIARHMRETGTLVRELIGLRISTRISTNHTGHTRIGADGYGEHDDLAIALALACWRARKTKNEFGLRRLF